LSCRFPLYTLRFKLLSVNTYKTEGIILKRSDFGEADRLLTIFTKRQGKIRVLAKGVRRLTSRKGGNLELFNQVRIFVREGKSLDLVTEVELLRSFGEWRKDLPKVAVAYQLCELADKLTAEHQKHPEVYELLAQNLSDLTNSVPDCQLLIANYQLSLLESLGFWPRGRSCEGVNLEKYIESLIERELKSKSFLRLSAAKVDRFVQKGNSFVSPLKFNLPILSNSQEH